MLNSWWTVLRAGITLLTHHIVNPDHLLMDIYIFRYVYYGKFLFTFVLFNQDIHNDGQLVLRGSGRQQLRIEFQHIDAFAHDF